MVVNGVSVDAGEDYLLSRRGDYVIITITGRNFHGATSVKFGDDEATSISVVSATEIIAIAPGRMTSGTVDIGVTTPCGTDTRETFFTYLDPPTVTGVDPSSGPLEGEIEIIIDDTNFTDGSTVKVGGTTVDDVTFVNSSQLKVIVPPGSAGPANVEVETPGGTTAANTLFTYLDVPTLTGVDPSNGPLEGGIEIIINGTNFTDGSTVKVDGTTVDDVTFVNIGQLKIILPLGSAGPANVEVETPGSATTANMLFTYRGAPSVTNIAPDSGPIAGGTVVVIIGSEFTGATAVQFEDVDATSFRVDNDKQITATTPPGSAGTASVEVTTPFGTSGPNDIFTYTASVEKTRRMIASFMRNRALGLLNGNGQGYNLTFTSSLDRIWGLSEKQPQTTGSSAAIAPYG